MEAGSTSDPYVYIPYIYMPYYKHTYIYIYIYLSLSLSLSLSLYVHVFGEMKITLGNDSNVLGSKSRPATYGNLPMRFDRSQGLRNNSNMEHKTLHPKPCTLNPEPENPNLSKLYACVAGVWDVESLGRPHESHLSGLRLRLSQVICFKYPESPSTQ